MHEDIKPIREFKPEHLPLPSNPMPYCSSTKLSLEIGAGAGLHAIRFAQENSDFHHIAIERTSEKFNKMKRRSEKHQLSNLNVFQDDAINWVTHNCQDTKFEKIFLLYPNPYPKNHSARWIRMPFFSKLIQCMNENTELIIATNEKFYIEEFELYAENYWKLSALKKETINSENTKKDYEALTHFEKKYLERGQDCFHYSYTK